VDLPALVDVGRHERRKISSAVWIFLRWLTWGDTSAGRSRSSHRATHRGAYLDLKSRFLFDTPLSVRNHGAFRHYLGHPSVLLV